jgi:hypothetical protein
VSATPKEWQPKIGEEYYVVVSDDTGGHYVHRWRFANDEMGKRFIRANNYFRTRELAIVAMNAIESAIGKLFKESEHG